MRRDDGDALGVGAFGFDDSNHSVRGGIWNTGAAPADPRTAAQLLKLHRLVESLVIRELERGETPNDGAQGKDVTGRSQNRQSEQLIRSTANGGGISGGVGVGANRGRKLARHALSNDSTITSLDAASMPCSSGGSDGILSGATEGTGTGRRMYAVGTTSADPPRPARSGFRSTPSGALEEGVHNQVAALQTQLALLGQQLDAAYRAAGVGEEASGVGPRSAAGAGSGVGLLRGQGQGQQNPTGLAAETHGSMSSADAAAAVMTGSGSGGPHRSASSPAAATMLTSLQHQRQRQQQAPPACDVGSPRHSSPRSHIRQPSSAHVNLSIFRRGGAGGDGGSGDSAGAPDGGSGGLVMVPASGSSFFGSGSLRPSNSSRQDTQQATLEGLGREASSREDERLRNWIQELRLERRRLEDRLLEGDPSGGASGAQEMRDDLEKQVLSLSRQRDHLALQLEELGVTQTINEQLAAQVDALETALAAEVERVVRLKEVRPVLEGKLAEVSASLESLRRQHEAAMQALVQERDAALSKARRHAKRTGELEAAVEAAHGEVRRLQDEVRGHVMSLAEMRAGGEVLQSASQQMQANMEAHAKENATRLATVQSQLEASQSECVILRRQLEAAQREATMLRDQLKDSQARVEVHSTERSRLGTSLAAEQKAVAAARQQVESLTAQLKAGDEARADLAKAASAQLEAVERQHAADIAATQKQYDSQLAVAEKQYLLLQRQYDAGLASSNQATEAATALRRERDALWAETQNLKTELDEIRTERNELSSKLTSLRVEVRNAMEEVARDRDMKLATAKSQHEVAMRELRAEVDKRTGTMRQDYESKLANVLDAAEKLRAEAQEAQRQAEKYRTAAGHLKEQVRDLLLSRDAAERELASERAFNEELNRILSTLREEQHTQHQHHTMLQQQRQ
ncbi:hypothetical protein Vretimale_8976, partial [Volvox reticuliferus]